MELDEKVLWPYRVLVKFKKKSIKNSGLRIVIRIRSKTECFVASQTSHPSKNFIRICGQLLELSAKYVEFPLSDIGKNSFKSG